MGRLGILGPRQRRFGGFMVRVMYISRARHQMSRGELSDLLAGARLRNEQHGITGILVYNAGYFAQILEGEEASIESLLANIKKDPRHDEYYMVSRGDIEERYFTGWAMDWVNLESLGEQSHRDLRLLLGPSGIADRNSVYRALLTFMEAHSTSRSA